MDLKFKMQLYREGLAALPEEYVWEHRVKAEHALQILRDKGLVLHRAYMDNDGWYDGMKVLFVVGEYKDKLIKLQWHDGNEEFFVKLESGGSAPFKL